MTEPADNVVTLSPPVIVPRGRVSKPQNVDKIYRFSAAGIRPERLATVLRDTERGLMERWADLAEYILRTDPHVRSVADTVIRSITASELRVTAAKVKPGLRNLAEEQAHFIRESLSKSFRLGETLDHLLHGYLVGVSGVEHQWKREQGVWFSAAQKKVYARDLEWSPDWTTRVRTFVGDKSRGQWVATDVEPARWIIHQPGAIGTTPNLAGALQAVVWPWLFKRWAQIYQQRGLEKFANPLAVGKLGDESGEEAREAFFEGLDRLVAHSSCVIEQDQTIELLEASKNPSDSWGGAIGGYNAEITKALLGSTLNVEIAEPGGNRAAAESQASITIIPRLQSIATSLMVTIREQWVAPAMFFNTSLFNGYRIPPPELGIVLKQEEGPRVTPELVAAGAITVNELREAHGFAPLDDERGKEIVKPIMKAPMPKQQPGAPKPKPGEQASFQF